MSMAALLLLSMPIFALNLWVMNKGAWSKLLDPWKLQVLGVEALWTLMTARFILQASWAGFWLFFVMSSVIVCANLYFLFALKNYALAFYALFLLIMAGLYLLNLYKLLHEPYYRSGKKWFEGLPRFVPNIQAEIKSQAQGAETSPARVSRLNHEGCYLYSEKAGLAAFNAPSEVVLKLGDLRLECAVELITRSSDGMGQGLRFLADSADRQKDIRDFIDRVRSSGYVH
jgi:hypothetical protein